MPHVTRLRVISAAVAAGALTLGGVAIATAAQAVPRRALAGTHPEWATAAHRVGSRAVSTGTVAARVYLAGRDPAALAAYATAVTTPGDALYRHFLSPAQVQARFATTPAQLTAVESWLRGSGLTVTSVDNRVAGGYVGVRGPVAAASRAFAVTFGSYRTAGAVVRAPEQAASAPGGVASSVLTVSGLSTARQVMRPEKLPPPPQNFWVARPCNASYFQKIATHKPSAYGKRQPWALCGYTPRQVRRAYGVSSSGFTGAGQTVAIVDAYAAPTMLADANRYAKVVGDKPFAPGQYRQHLPAKFTDVNLCGAASWYGEETLDVESVHGMAPGANVRFVAAASCNDPDLSAALSYIVNHHLASIVSNSWGDTEDGAGTFTSVYHAIFLTGTAEGISFMFSSGDSGYESPAQDPGFSDKLQVDYPTSDPYVTSVGGTSLAIGRRDKYLFETSWGTLVDPLARNGKSWQSKPPGKFPAGFDGASGGGTSTLYAQPAYQAGVVPDSLSQTLPGGTHSATKMRVVPDVSAYADPATGFLVGETTLQPNGKTYAFSLSRIGGTSLACPTFAGIEADAQQAYQQTQHTSEPLGFANPWIYGAYAKDHRAFRDVTDHPLGRGHLAQVRVDYSNPYTKAGPLVYKLRTLGIDGEGAAALPAVAGYDDSTGVGSPAGYIQFLTAP
jgi:subtilase family serine protease